MSENGNLKDVVVRIGGEGGEGVMSAGEILTYSAARSSYRVFTFRTFPAEIKGGLAMYQFRVSPYDIFSMGDKLHILMAFNQEAFDNYSSALAEDGVLFYDPAECKPSDNFTRKKYEVPLKELAMASGTHLAKNMVATGFLSAVLGIPIEESEKQIADKFRRKGEKLLQQNLNAFRSGVEYAQRYLDELKRFRLGKPEGKDKRVILSGNQAIGFGAIAAGCKVAVGYPITPASPILEFLARHLPKFGGKVIQNEDEISALATCVGASYAGAKVLTPTSGPGLALMTELITYASMAELPVVIVDVQRAGPSTGMPSKTEQTDLYHVVFGGPGEAPRIVVAPAHVSDCFYQTVRAFNLAEEYQMPVIILSDQVLAYQTEAIPKPNLESIEVVNRLEPDYKSQNSYLRYKITETGLAPIAVPGHPGFEYIAPGLEHNERGAPNYTPKVHTEMQKKRFRKLDVLAEKLENENDDYYEVKGAKILIVAWGSTYGAIREAIEKAEMNGIKVSHYHPRILNPLPKRKIRNIIGNYEKVIVVEQNYNGQFANILRTFVDYNPIKLNNYGGIPFTSEEIYNKIIEVAK
jgi:2-oxoglutarate ferredoxin oxidoreductase subunit alpha